MNIYEAIGQGGGAALKSGYCVDIALLIDGTGSMSPIIEEVKRNAISFCKMFHEALEANGKNVEELRVKVIPFRDYGCDGRASMDDSGFFSLPDHNKEFSEYVNSIDAFGGGDEPESALEAMALAMRSDWTTKGTKRRHVIMLFTDASAVPLGDSLRISATEYPEDMPNDLKELSEMWSGCSQKLGGMPESDSARLVFFAPNVSPWNDIQVWNNVWPAYSKAGSGLKEVDFGIALNLLVNSVR